MSDACKLAAATQDLRLWIPRELLSASIGNLYKRTVPSGGMNAAEHDLQKTKMLDRDPCKPNADLGKQEGLKQTR